jgi:hypothetical protein
MHEIVAIHSHNMSMAVFLVLDLLVKGKNNFSFKHMQGHKPFC